MLKQNSTCLYYVSDKTGKRYELDLGYCINENDEKRTSDICYIIDSGLTEEEYNKWMNDDYNKEPDETFVGFFYGGTFLRDDNYKEEYAKIIKEIIDQYESQKTYNFTIDDIAAFITEIETDALLGCTDDKYNEDKCNIKINVGKHNIIIPCTADNYTELGIFLETCRNNTIEINKGEDKSNIQINQNYVDVKFIEGGSYTGVFQATIKVLNDEYVDGWEVLDFLTWLREQANEFLQKKNMTDNNDIFPKNIFFSIYSDYENEIPNIRYSLNFEDCIRTEKYVKYYRIYLNEDAELYKIDLETKTMEEMILKTLLAYQLTNEGYISEIENKNLEEQIQYIKDKIKGSEGSD